MNVKQLIQKTIKSKKGYKSNYYRTVYCSKEFDSILHVIRRNSFPARSIICVSPFLKKICSYCIRAKFEKQIVEQTLSLLGIKNIIIEYNKKLRSGDNHYLLFESRDRGLSLEYIPQKNICLKNILLRYIK